jgi:hypothetical protein
MPDGTRFCRECGASQVPAQSQAVQAAPPPPPPPPAGYYPPQGMTPRPAGGGSSKTLWIVLACVGVVVIALAVALPLVFLRGGDGETDDTIVVTTTVVSESSTTEPTTATTEPTTETTEAATTTTAKPAASVPGDSAGKWAETSISGLEQKVVQVAVSDDALLMQTGGTDLFAYMFSSGQTVLIPTSATTVGSIDIDGTLAVWWEANGADVITDAHVYAMRLPDGPKVEVASGVSVAYPQVVKGMVTWVEGKPWAAEPDAWWDYTIKGAAVDGNGQPTGAASTLVDYGSAVAATLGDSTWSYGLSEGFLAWEQQSDAGAIGAGSYVMDLAGMEPWRIDSNAWRPSLDKSRVVFTLDGIGYADFSGSLKTLDSAGDFATAAPTYAAYYRPKPSGDGTAWAIVAKGYTGKYEQVLLDDTGDPPWFLAPIAASGHHVAFALNGALRLFTWQD